MTQSSHHQAAPSSQVDTATQAQKAEPTETLIDFDSDEPLQGGMCDMSEGCQSCQ